jgi:hypothetical protein
MARSRRCFTSILDRLRVSAPGMHKARRPRIAVAIRGRQRGVTRQSSLRIVPTPRLLASRKLLLLLNKSR